MVGDTRKGSIMRVEKGDAELRNSAEDLANKIKKITAEIYILIEERFASFNIDEKNPDNMTSLLSEDESERLSKSVLRKTQELSEIANEMIAISSKMKPITNIEQGTVDNMLAAIKTDSERIDPEELYPGHAEGEYEDFIWPEESEGEDE